MRKVVKAWLFLAAGLLAAAGTGCGGGGADSDTVLRTDDRLPSRPATDTLDAIGGDQDAGSSIARELAAQSQRDVEAILNARLNDQNPPLAADLAGDSSRQEIPSEAAAVAIQWTDAYAQKAAATKHDPAPTEPAGEPKPQANSIATIADPAGETPTQEAPVLDSQAPVVGSDRVGQMMVELSRDLHARAAYSDTPLKQLLVISAMSLVDPSRVLNPDALPDLTASERELLGSLQQFFANLQTSLGDTEDVRAAVADAAAALHKSLEKRPELQLSTIALCTRVGGYGDYTPFEKSTFLAHSEQKTIVYLEIDEFTSIANEKGEFVTDLAQQLTIYSDRDGIPVWKEDWQSAVDVSKNRRQDFFTVQVVTLPKALSVGRYTLKIRVRDEKSGAETEGAVPFEMVADPRLAVSIR